MRSSTNRGSTECEGCRPRQMRLHTSCHKSVKAAVSIHPFVTAGAGAPGMVVWTSLLSAFKEGEGDEENEFAASSKPLSGCNLRVIPRRFISSPSILVDGVRSRCRCLLAPKFINLALKRKGV